MSFEASIPGRPVTVVLADHWESKTEAGWITRQVAGALATRGDLHVITPDGIVPGSSTDGVFTVHHLATPVTAAAELRHSLLVEGIVATSGPSGPEVTPALAGLLDQGTSEPWNGAVDLLRWLTPDLAVIVGAGNLGALDAVNRSNLELAVALLPLGSDPALLAFPHFEPLFRRAATVLAVTETERMAIVDRYAGTGSVPTVQRLGAPLAANPSARTEPNGWVGDTDSIIVLTGVDRDADDEEAALARLLRLRFPDLTVGVAHRDAFCAWRHGQVTSGWPIERSGDLDRLLAFARVFVDLDPGRLFARRCVTSLLFGTPIVVPAASRAREHAERGRGGLWFNDPSELVWAVEALLEPMNRDPCRAQGLAYAQAEYGSTEGFINRVTAACAPGVARSVA
jgi:hypothetical protein